ncbi:hypothetical protein EDB81DRAFT_772778 [Dactylonectria macrodidyma]|uniref:Secreted protein n=1 Tax=Dactylonectria macrodidyma TaxID=307937 RepID=A0A9P9JRP7_9HYPO|nr:hypothetical protein EDB81DRAFT_772778 [Dactylonectria macrodidyma]
MWRLQRKCQHQPQFKLLVFLRLILGVRVCLSNSDIPKYNKTTFYICRVPDSTSDRIRQSNSPPVYPLRCA